MQDAQRYISSLEDSSKSFGQLESSNNLEFIDYQSLSDLKKNLVTPLEVLEDRFGQSAAMSLTKSQANIELQRLDSMLVDYGIIGPIDDEKKLWEESATRTKIAELRESFEREMESWGQKNQEMKGHVAELFRQQAQVRLITEEELVNLQESIDEKMKRIEIEIKNQTCQKALAEIQKKYDGRRSRRNLPEKAIEILEKYFVDNIGDPYPSEKVKKQLAKAAGITYEQTNIWFMNKRMRYKRKQEQGEKKKPSKDLNEKDQQPSLRLEEIEIDKDFPTVINKGHYKIQTIPVEVLHQNPDILQNQMGKKKNKKRIQKANFEINNSLREFDQFDANKSQFFEGNFIQGADLQKPGYPQEASPYFNSGFYQGNQLAGAPIPSQFMNPLFYHSTVFQGSFQDAFFPENQLNQPFYSFPPNQNDGLTSYFPPTPQFVEELNFPGIPSSFDGCNSPQLF